MTARFQRWYVVLAAGEVRTYDPAEWRDALVLVDRGLVELELADGARCGFGQGATLCFVGLAPRALRNPGRVPLVLVVISRRGTDSFSAVAPSHG